MKCITMDSTPAKHAVAAALMAALTLLTTGCGKITELENQVAALEQERADLQQVVSEKDGEAVEIANAVDDVLTRVTELTARQGRLRVQAHEAEIGAAQDVASVRNVILGELSWLDGELADNRARLTELSHQLAGLEGEGSRQVARIGQLEKMISTQELLIKDLRLDTERLEERAATLLAEKGEVEEAKAMTEDELQQLAEIHQSLQSQYDTLEGDVGRGFILVGDKKRIKELKKVDILQDRGKLVVAGSAVESSDAATEHFRAVSVVSREVRLGDLDEDLVVLSPHREQAGNFWFERKGDDLFLMLRDPGLFWGASHFLVLRQPS